MSSSDPPSRSPANGDAPGGALPAPPAIALTRDGSALADARPFLRVRNLDLVAHYPEGTMSAPFAYSLVERRALDAVVVVAYVRPARHEGLRVFVRSAVRPPLGLRVDGDVPADAGPIEASADANQWEVPAGLIDPGESPRAAAARETQEELGFALGEERFEALGHYTYPVPAMIAERQHYVAVDVTDAPRGTPTEDGSPLEHDAAILLVEVAELLDMARRGDLRDAKTELALRRLLEHRGLAPATPGAYR